MWLLRKMLGWPVLWEAAYDRQRDRRVAMLGMGGALPDAGPMFQSAGGLQEAAQPERTNTNRVRHNFAHPLILDVVRPKR
jgi:hypothetical protein